ncbi:hypothetical protein P59_202 [Bacillus phage P59]|nr:hypothetical protein P59_202 [Bacillus phage P59]
MGRFNTKIALYCEGELVNKHSDAKRGMSKGWNNPLDEVPAIGTKIEYKTFDQGSKEGQGERTLYKVVDIVYSTEEDYNNMYTNKVVEVHLLKLS